MFERSIEENNNIKEVFKTQEYQGLREKFNKLNEEYKELYEKGKNFEGNDEQYRILQKELSEKGAQIQETNSQMHQLEISE